MGTLIQLYNRVKSKQNVIQAVITLRIVMKALHFVIAPPLIENEPYIMYHIHAVFNFFTTCFVSVVKLSLVIWLADNSNTKIQAVTVVVVTL